MQNITRTITHLLLLIFTCILTACHNNNGQVNRLEKQIQKTVKLAYDFTIKVGQKEGFEKFETYTLFILTRHGETLFLDSSLTEYQFDDELFPIINNLGDNAFEILVEVNDRPNKNYLKRIHIKNDHLIMTNNLPAFVSAASNLDKDKNLEYAGFWDYAQQWGDSNQLTAYNPIIYYEITPTGLRLDSSLTVDRNKFIYGKFNGFVFNENFEMPVSVTENFEKEITRITKMKK